MTEPNRAVAIERLSALLEDDVLTVEQYNGLVARVLASTSTGELEVVLADVPTAATPSLVIVCGSGVVKEVPMVLPETVELRLDSGVLKVDLSKAEIESPITDLEIEAFSGVLKVVMPHEAVIEVAEHVADGGVFRNRAKPVTSESWRPRIVVHVRNQGAVVKLTRARR